LGQHKGNNQPGFEERLMPADADQIAGACDADAAPIARAVPAQDMPKFPNDTSGSHEGAMPGGRAYDRPRGSKGPHKSRYLLTLDAIDKRTSAFRKTTELISSIETDLGGPDRLSTAERQIVQRASLHGAMLESLEAAWLSGQEVDLGLYATITNSQRRLLETVGLRRQARDVTPSLSAYIQSKSNGAP
jgi:hypothetical protein